MIAVKRVNRDKRGLKDFIDFPYWLYRNDKNWCPPLRLERKRFFSHKNPFMLHSKVVYFVAYEGKRPAGRVTAHIDEIYNSYYNTRQGFFGFFESIESLEAAEKLMSSAENWLKSNGIYSIMGPFNFSTNHEVGFLTKGFERPPVIMMPYTKKYYPDLLYKLGYQKEKELIAYWLGNGTKIPEIVRKSAEKLTKRFGDSVEIRNTKMKNLRADLGITFDIYNDAWSKNWGFVPITNREIDEVALGLRLVADPGTTCLLYKNGEPAAFMIAVPDINEVLINIKEGRLFPTGVFRLLLFRKYIQNVRVILMGVKGKYRRLGLDFLMYYKYLYESSCNGIEMSWILEDNVMMNSVFERLNADPYKRYVILKKMLEE